ncbi:MAG: Bax inhibitor-1/YccA family protein [Holosporaceae bacterium]|nr:Bax inhibitor-1/YccA family protein [Holosporaceae bacterium]
MKIEAKRSYVDVTRIVDAGLRKYMQNVFSHMSAGLLITAVVAYIMSLSDAFVLFLATSRGTSMLLSLVPLGIAMYLGAKINSISVDRARALFFVYAAMLGFLLSVVVASFSSSSLVVTFFVTSSMFLSMVIYGYTTGKDLTSWGSFLLMGLVGIIIAGFVNLFFMNSMTSFIISAIGVIVFTGLTAYDMQRIKSYYLQSDHPEIGEKKAIIGALMLYLDFINLFLSLLRFLGKSRD